MAREMNNKTELSNQGLDSRIEDLGFSVRVINCLKGHDINTLRDLILTKGETLLKFRNFGAKCINEVWNFLSVLGLRLGTPEKELSYISETVLDKLRDKNNDIEDSQDKSARHSGRISEVLKESSYILLDFQDAHGYFPVFLALKMYLESLPDREKLISHRLDIYSNPIVDLEDKITSLGYSRERIRQLVIDIFKKLVRYINTLGSLNKEESVNISYSGYDYSSIMKEETDIFNDKFISFVLSHVLRNEYTLIGDSSESFFGRKSKEAQLILVKSSYTSAFKCNKYVNYLLKLKEEKRYESSRILLDEILGNYAKQDVTPIYDNLKTECIRIASLLGFKSSEDSILLERNDYYPIPDYIEMMIRKKGAPMSVEEICSSLSSYYIGKEINRSIVYNNSKKNPNIALIGRSSLYTLAEWDGGSSRGGTIREFAEEFLEGKTGHIASVGELTDYIKQFRKTASENSVSANLSAEESGFFLKFYRGRNVYFGLSKYSYSCDSFDEDSQSLKRRSFEESCSLLLDFVRTHGRLPSFTDSEEEARLRRFYAVQMNKIKDETLSQARKESILSIAMMLRDRQRK